MSEHCGLVEQECPRGSAALTGAVIHAADRADDLVQDTLVRALARILFVAAGDRIRVPGSSPERTINMSTRCGERRVSGAAVDIEHVSSTRKATTDPTVQDGS